MISNKVKNLSVKNNKKKTTVVKWKQINGASGYQVQYALDKKFTKNRKYKIVNDPVLIIKKLKKGNRYFFRVRAFIIDDDGDKNFGKWSVVKKVKIKK